MEKKTGATGVKFWWKGGPEAIMLVPHQNAEQAARIEAPEARRIAEMAACAAALHMITGFAQDLAAPRPPVTPEALVLRHGFPFTEVSGTITHACGVITDGFAKCWGSNDGGQQAGNSPFFGWTVRRPH